MDRFSGQVALITGAGSGIGAATADRLASEGAAVAVCDIDVERAKSVASTLEAAGHSAAAIDLDVSDRQAFESAIAEVLDNLGSLEVIVNNAGVGSLGALGELTDDEIDRLLRVNVKGVLNGMAAGARVLSEIGGGTIVNTASVAGLYGVPLQVLYSATKGAVIAATRAAAMELAPAVRVNAVCPGGVHTGFTRAMVGPELAEVIEAAGAGSHPIGRMAEPAEVAAAIAYLASEDAAFVTGSALVVDGGFSSGEALQLV